MPQTRLLRPKRSRDHEGAACISTTCSSSRAHRTAQAISLSAD
nr:MAG TPA: hypothetical protein [Caudoviricetes sp.]